MSYWTKEMLDAHWRRHKISVAGIKSNEEIWRKRGDRHSLECAQWCREFLATEHNDWELLNKYSGKTDSLTVYRPTSIIPLKEPTTEQLMSQFLAPTAPVFVKE